MAKRSTNFTGKKPMKTKHIFSLMQWVGMSDEEIRAAHPFRSLAGMVYTACPCGCGAKEICDDQRARVKANDDALPF